MDMTLDHAITRWRELLREDPVAGDQDALRAKISKDGLVENGRLLCNVLRPRFVTATRHAEERRASTTILEALQRVLAGVESGEISDAPLGDLADWVRRVRELDPNPKAVRPAFLRLDASLARTQLHFVELNADMPIGEAHNDGVVDLFERLPTTRRIQEEFGGGLLRLLPSYDCVIDRALATVDEAGRSAIAWVFWNETPQRREVTTALVEHTERRGLHVVMADPRELRVGPRATEVDGVRVGLVFRVCTTLECIERPDDAWGLVQAARSDHTVVLNPLGTAPLGHKALFAALTDPTLVEGLPSAHRRAVSRHVPWTRLLREERTTGPHGEEVDLLPWVVAHRAELVLKPVGGFAGQGVVLGWRVEQSTWEEAVAAGGEMVVQVRVHLQRERYPIIAPGFPEGEFYEDTDPFLFDAVPGGVLTRLSASELTNITTGGGLTATMVLGAS